MKGLFPELEGTRRGLKLLPISERHLKEAAPGADGDVDDAEAAE